MRKISLWEVAFVALALVMIFAPEFALAQFAGGGELQDKVGAVTSGLINFLLPAASILGLAYSGILAASGDASAKQRMTMIIICSVIAMLAPLIIRWLQGMTH